MVAEAEAEKMVGKCLAWINTIDSPMAGIQAKAEDVPIVLRMRERLRRSEIS